MLAALLAASLALAAQVRDVDGYLGRMDADGDGRVSLAEYQAWMGYGFDALDRNHDGVLSTSELPGGHGAPLAFSTRPNTRALPFCSFTPVLSAATVVGIGETLMLRSVSTASLWVTVTSAVAPPSLRCA